MLIRGLERRLRKLESARTTGVFVAWGRDDADVEQVIKASRAGGLIWPGDLLVRALWTGSNEVPPPRWVAEQLSDLRREEDEALSAEMERRINLEDIAWDVPNPAMDAKVREMTDAQLFAAVLGEPLN